MFLGVPDRGPFDGRTDVPYPTRFHLFHITVNPSAPFPNITTVLLDTRFLTATGNTSLPGDAYEFETRFDPEGARVDAEGNFYVSDEYGPYILKFNRQGHLQARIEVPARFLLDAVTGHTSGDINNLSRNGLADVTDVSNVPALPEKGTDLAAMGITPVKKTLFLDLLKDVYKVNATQRSRTSSRRSSRRWPGGAEPARAAVSARTGEEASEVGERRRGRLQAARPRASFSARCTTFSPAP